MNQAAAKIHSLGETAGRHLVTVASGKGGVGKTWFAATLAHALARLDRGVLLVDGDLGLANVDVQLGIQPRWDLASVLSGRVRLRQAIERFEAGGFDILAGRSGSGVLATVGREKLLGLRHTLARLGRLYDHVVLDLGAGIDSPVRLLMGGQGTILVVTTGEPTALTDAYAFIKIARMKYPGADLRIVVNACGNEQDGRRTYATLASACRTFLKLDLPLAGIVPFDRHVRDAIRRQVPMLVRHPATPAGVSVERLAQRLVSAT